MRLLSPDRSSGGARPGVEGPADASPRPARPERRSSVTSILALATFALVAIPLAAPGPALVPAARVTHAPWLLGPYGRGFGLTGRPYLVLLVLAFVLYLAVVANAPRLHPRTLACAIVALTALFLLAPPLLSRDVFSYIAYGRLGAVHHLNPYVAVPADRMGDPVFPFVGWQEAPSAYGPLFTLMTYPVGALSLGVALWVMKSVSALTVLAVAWLTAWVAGRRGLSATRAASIVALNPLVLVHVVGGAHNDALVALGLMVAVASLLHSRRAVGAPAVVATIGIKVSGAFAAPFVVLGGRGEKPRLSRRAIAGSALAAAALCALAAAVFGVHALDPLRLIGQNQRLMSHYSVPATLARLTKLPAGLVRVVAVAALACAFIALVRRTVKGGDAVDAMGWSGLALLLSTSWLLPWYVIWVLPVAAVARDRRILATLLALCAVLLVDRIPL